MNFQTRNDFLLISTVDVLVQERFYYVCVLLKKNVCDICDCGSDFVVLMFLFCGSGTGLSFFYKFTSKSVGTYLFKLFIQYNSSMTSRI